MNVNIRGHECGNALHRRLGRFRGDRGTWWTLAVAAFLALVFGQVALVAHDVAHRQVFRRRGATDVSGRIAGVCIGMGYGWWRDKHTRHHANPNHEGLDPDIAPDLLVWSQD